MPVIKESFTCCNRFAEKFEKVTGQEYLKKDRHIYRKLLEYGDEEKAIKLAERCYRKCLSDGKEKPSEMWPACRVYRLVREVCEKVNKFSNNEK